MRLNGAMNMRCANKRLFFLHIPKAAGTTFKEVLYHNYRFSRIAWIDGSYPSESVERLKAMKQGWRDRKACVMGHFQYGLHECFNGPYTYVTFLRNPVDRVISTYYHILRKSTHHRYHRLLNDENLSLEEFVRKRVSSEVSNLQTAWISGESEPDSSSLEKAKMIINSDFSFAGISEAFDASLIMLCRETGLEVRPYPNLNIGEYKQKEVPETTRNVILEANQLDLELYEWVKDRLSRKVSEVGQEFQNDLSQFQQELAEFTMPTSGAEKLHERLLNRWRLMSNPIRIREL